MPGRIAPLVMARQWRMGSLAGPLGASGAQSNGDPVQVELFIDGVWVDITSYVMTRDGGEKISITRGRRDEGSSVEHSTCSFQLNNRDGRFSPRNPNSEYFGLLGRNQELRVSVPGPTGEKLYRFWGEVSSWPQRWDISGRDIWVDVEAAGLLRRLNQGAAPARSTMYEGVTNPVLGSLLAYWPCEDGENSERIASPLVNGSPMTLSGTPDFASYTGFGGSDPLPVVSTASLSGGVAGYDESVYPSLQVRFLLHVPFEGLDDQHVIARLQMDDTAVKYWDVSWNGTAGVMGATLGSLTLMARDSSEIGLPVTGTQVTETDIRGRSVRVSVELTESGADTALILRTVDAHTGVTTASSGTVTGVQLSRLVSVTMFPALSLTGQTVGGEGCVVGHITVQGETSSATDLSVQMDPSGETAGRRVQRICAQEGIPFDAIGDLDETVVMGGQGRDKPLAVMRDAELVDGGMLFENLSVFGMGYRTRTSMLNQAAALTLDYADHELSEVPEPVEDDQNVKNKITVIRESGDTPAVAEATVGTMSTADPPAGIGIYGDDVTLNVVDDTTLMDQAYWRLQLGTVDEARYPQISVNLARSEFVDNPTLKAQALTVRQGDRLVLENPPSWLPPDDISQLVLGISETIDHFEHRITYMCAPESPWRAGVLEDEILSRIDTDGSELYQGITSSDTTVYVEPTGESSLWTTDAADFPFDVRVGGEVMTVSSISPVREDDFERVEASTWGTSSGGIAWALRTSTPDTDLTVNGTQGVVTLAANPSLIRILSQVSGVSDCEVRVTMSVSQVATGAAFLPAIVMRWISNAEYYRGRVYFDLLGVMRTGVTRGTTLIGSATTLPFTYAAGDEFHVRARVRDKRVQIRAWPTSWAEPTVWYSDEIIDTGAIPVGDVGLSASAFSTNTNVNPELRYDNFEIVSPQTFTVARSVNGVVKAQVENEDVRLAYPTIISM